MLVSDECDQVYNSMENEIVTLKLLTQQMLLEVLSDEDNHNPYNDDLENYIILLGEALSVENPVLRLQNHVERVMPFYDDEQFKLHFKYVLYTFLYTFWKGYTSVNLLYKILYIYIYTQSSISVNY